MNCNNQPSRPDSYASSDGNGPSASGNASQPIQNIPMMMEEEELSGAVSNVRQDEML